MTTLGPSRAVGAPRRIDAALLMRFVLIGAINTGFSYSIYCLLVAWGAGYAAACFFALLAGIGWSFLTNGKLVFATTLKGRLPGFLAVWAFLYLLNIALIRLLLLAGANPYAAGLLAAFPMAALGFLLQRRFVFRMQT